MIEVGYKDFLLVYQKKKKLFLLLTILSFAILLSASILFLLLIKYPNRNFYMIFGSIVVFLLAFISFSLLFIFLLPTLRREKHIKRILYGEKTKSIGKVISIGEMVSVFGGIKAREIKLQDENEEWVAYFDEEYADLPFEEGEDVTLITSSSFVVAYEKD